METQSYELTFLVESEKDRENVKKVLSGSKATITKEEPWGKRELAYKIKQHTFAFYFTFVFKVNSKEVKEIKQKLNFDDTIIRYLLLKHYK